MTPGSLCVSSYYEFEALGESPEVGSQPATSFKTRGGTPNPPLGIPRHRSGSLRGVWCEIPSEFTG